MKKITDKQINQTFNIAKERYAEYGVNVDTILKKVKEIPISLHCWQGDDVTGFENLNEKIDGGGIQATGNYPGKAKNPEELRADISKAMSLIPGKHRLNLHACYAEHGKKRVERNLLEPVLFKGWMEWAKAKKIGLDFNPTFFAHKYAADGFTLSHKNKKIRDFWIEHGIACRKISEYFGKNLKTTTVTNFWIPDGYKDIPFDRISPRERLSDSLDKIFKVKVDSKYNIDAVEGKLFGIGSESYVVGSHEFYLSYAIKNNKLLCLDAGHFHPTETIADKISSVLLFLDEVLLHVSRPVRWDSDHVVIMNDDLIDIARSIVRKESYKKIHIGLDFFDASINRIAAWVIGTRNMIKALIFAMLEPETLLCRLESSGDFTKRLAIMEEMKALPWSAVWDYYCLVNDVPVGYSWMSEVDSYEKTILSKRN